ncbi:MAG: peptidoglycan editing factor PgeF [Gammaproteobacteria bacterium]
MPDWIEPDWPVPPSVHALSTTRAGGVSSGAWESLNLGAHVGDNPASVAENRRILAREAGLPSEPLWLKQVHGCAVADPAADGRGCEADAAVSDTPGRVCAVMTADCLPVLLANRAGTRVAAAHAGWRGLAGGVLEQTVAHFADAPADIIAWLGPAIGPQAFEVGDEVRDAFVSRHAVSGSAFAPARPGHWLADLYALARNHLAAAGVRQVHGGGFCTWSDSERFFSYRRDGVTGRMATLIWLE